MTSQPPAPACLTGPHHVNTPTPPDIPILLASELASSSVMHSHSRLPGGIVTVTVTGTVDVTRVEVRDAGGMSAPSLKGAVTRSLKAVVVSGSSMTWRPAGITAAMRTARHPV
jgi:hypothetical protein